MIGRLRGELIESNGGMVVVDCAGVGYEVLVPDSVLVRLPSIGERVDLYIRQVFREDGVSLYGFIEPFQRRIFDLLTEVKGCGPKIGLSLLGQLGEHAVANSILVQDSKALCRATGVGPRLAERIILELKDKVTEENLIHKFEQSQTSRAVIHAKSSSELYDALISLGYRRIEVDAVIDHAEATEGSLEDKIRVALRSLAK